MINSNTKTIISSSRYRLRGDHLRNKVLEDNPNWSNVKRAIDTSFSISREIRADDLIYLFLIEEESLRKSDRSCCLDRKRSIMSRYQSSLNHLFYIRDIDSSDRSKRDRYCSSLTSCSSLSTPELQVRSS